MVTLVPRTGGGEILESDCFKLLDDGRLICPECFEANASTAKRTIKILTEVGHRGGDIVFVMVD